MKKILLLLLLTAVFFACKKDEAKLPTEMRVQVDEDTVFVTANVTTDNDNSGTVYITGTSNDNTKRVKITLFGYNGSKKVFDIDYRGVGGNILGSTAQYKYGANLIQARSGKITITSAANGLINGTFYFFSDQTRVAGSFSAPQH